MTTIKGWRGDDWTPMLVKAGEPPVVIQLNPDNIQSVVTQNFIVDPWLEGKIYDKANLGDEAASFGNIVVPLISGTARPDFRYTGVSLSTDRDDDYSAVFVNEGEGRGVMVEADEFSDALADFDSVNELNHLSAFFNVNGLAEQIQDFRRGVDSNSVTSISVQFDNPESVYATAEINYGNGETIVIPKRMYDQIMDKASTRDAQSIEVTGEPSAPPAVTS